MQGPQDPLEQPVQWEQPAPQGRRGPKAIRATSDCQVSLARKAKPEQRAIRETKERLELESKEARASQEHKVQLANLASERMARMGNAARAEPPVSRAHPVHGAPKGTLAFVTPPPA